MKGSSYALLMAVLSIIALVFDRTNQGLYISITLFLCTNLILSRLELISEQGENL